MSELSETLESINAAFAQVNGVTAPNVSENMSVSAYLAVIDQLRTLALQKVDESIRLAIDAGRFVDVTTQLTMLRGMRETLLELHADVHAALDGMAPTLTLAAAWDRLTAEQGGGTAGGSTADPNAGNTGSGTTPDTGTNTGTGTGSSTVYPPSDAVVLYGTTPMLLRSNDASVPITAQFTRAADQKTVTSPRIDIANESAWQIGGVSGSGMAEAKTLIKSTTVNGLKGLLGELIGSSDVESAKLSFQAWEAYELGKTLTDKGSKSIDFITSGLDVINGRKSLAEWNAEHNAFLGETENEFKATANSAIVSKIPIVGWVLSPVVDAFQKLSYKLQNTTSFEISVTAETRQQGGNLGGVFIGGVQDDVIRAGNGGVLAAGGAGNDRFEAGSGSQSFVGEAGIDTVVYALAGNGLRISGSNGIFTIEGAIGKHTLLGIERVVLADRQLALDMAAGQAGAKAALLIGAALDKAGMTPTLVGQALQLFDQGKSMTEVAALAMASPEFKARAANLTDEQFITTVFTNVVGVAPTAAQHAEYLGLLQGHGGNLSQAALLALAAETAINAVNVDLVGLQQSGLVFV